MRAASVSTAIYLTRNGQLCLPGPVSLHFPCCEEGPEPVQALWQVPSPQAYPEEAQSCGCGGSVEVRRRLGQRYTRVSVGFFLPHVSFGDTPVQEWGAKGRQVWAAWECTRSYLQRAGGPPRRRAAAAPPLPPPAPRRTPQCPPPSSACARARGRMVRCQLALFPCAMHPLSPGCRPTDMHACITHQHHQACTPALLDLPALPLPLSPTWQMRLRMQQGVSTPALQGTRLPAPVWARKRNRKTQNTFFKTRYSSPFMA